MELRPLNRATLATLLSGMTLFASNALAAPATTDISDDGSVTDANNNKNPNEAGENDPTPFTYVSNPQIGVAKSASETTSNGDGSFSTVITLNIKNVGDIALTEVQLMDDIKGQLPENMVYKVEELTSVSGNLTVNAEFNGADKKELLSGTDKLNVNAVETVTFKLTFTPRTEAGPFQNVAEASANSPQGSPKDLSDDGSEIDANNNRDATEDGENDPTSITYVSNPAIGLAKAATEGQSNGDGSFTSTITLRVKNMGDIPLGSVQLVDNMAEQFGSGVKFTIADLATTGSLTVNPNFNGDSDANLLSGEDVMEVGQEETITFKLTFTPDGSELANSATANAAGPHGTTTDKSAEGDKWDIDGDGTANGTDEDKPTIISYLTNPVIGLAKAAATTVSNGDGTFSTTITMVVENLGDTKLTNVQVVDDVRKQLPEAVTFTISDISSSNAEALPVNAAFNGESDVNMLDPAKARELPIGAKETVTFKLTFTPNGEAGPFENSATATADAIGGSSSNSSDDTPTTPTGLGGLGGS